MAELRKGDAYELIREIPDKSVDLIMTDPPYEFGTRGGNLAHRQVFSVIEGAELANGIDYSILDEFMRVMKIPNIYIWCNKAQLITYTDYFVKRHGLNFDIVIWNKTNPIPFCCGHYLRDKEYCLFFWKKGAHLKGSFSTMKTVYTLPKETQVKKLYPHPTIKPLSMIRNLIENSTEKGQVVLDPFMGSGTTGVACRELGREFIGFEKEGKYYEMAQRRINENGKQ